MGIVEDRQDEGMPPVDPRSIQIKVDGSALLNGIMSKLEKFTVEQHAWGPSRFEIRFRDEDIDIMDGEQFDVGKEVEISSEGESLIKGEVTALQPVFDMFGPSSLIVRGHTKDNRLIRGTYIRTFLNQKDSDIASTVAGECELQADVDSTSVTHEQVFQHNLTNMAFLTHLARRNGFTCYAEDDRLCFKKPSKGGQSPSLALGEELRSFQPHVDASKQVDKVTIKGWDPKGKKAISFEVTSTETPFLTQIGFQNSGGDLAKQAFGSAELAVVDQPISSPDEAKPMAQARFNEMDGTSVEAEGVASFNPNIKAGSWVEVEGVGSKYSGSYWVGTATHVYEMRSGETRFSTDGRPAEISEGPDRWPGVVPAQVTDLNDPDDLGRVKVKFPWLDDNAESTWARVVAIGAGPEYGMLVLPEVNDEVLVVFEHGDFNRPYVLGGLWSSTDKPPLPSSEAAPDGKVNLRTWKSRSGHQITMDDTEGAEKLEIISKNEHRITMDNTVGAEKLEISTARGHLITMDDTEGEENLAIQTQGGNRIAMDDKVKELAIQTQGGHKVTLDDTQNMITIESPVDMVLKAAGNLDLKATNLSLAGDALVEIKGGVIKLN